MTASQRIFLIYSQTWRQLSALSLTDIALNLGLTAAVAAVATLLCIAASRLIRAAVRRLPGDAIAEKTVLTARWARRFSALTRVALIVLATGLEAQVWGLDPWFWTSTALGQRVAETGTHLALLAATAFIAVEAAHYVIGHAMSHMASGAADPRRQAQLRTLDPLLRGLAQTGILVILVLMALSEVGVKVGPLLAGAGVVGIAVGFGAQSVVKDLLTGVFLIIEDIVSVGDVVRIGDSGGLVEGMTLRTIRLRDFDGTLHVFPYGEAQVVHNLTKSFSYCVFNLQVSYGSNLDRALSVMRDVGAGLQSDSAFRDKILEPIEVVGVDNLADSGVVLKARIKTQPIQQWVVGREYNRRIKLAFDREGIEIPFPHMQVVLPETQLNGLGAH